MNIEELIAAMKEITDVAETENRALSDEEVERYEALEKDLAAAKKTEEIRNRQNAYETPNSKSVIHAVKNADETLERAFDQWLRTGVPNQDLIELRAMEAGTTTAGGYLVPTGFRTTLVERMKRFGGIAEEAQVINTDSGNPIGFPTLDDTANSAVIKDEGEQFGGGADLVLGTKTLGAFKYTTTGAGNDPLRVSVELLQDAAFDVGALVSNQFAKRIRRAQAADYAQGAGTTEPLGLLTTTSDLNNSADELTYAKLNSMKHLLDPEYRTDAVWVMNDSTLAEIEAIVDTTGRPLLNSSISGISDNPSAAGTLLGKPVIIDNSIVVASGNNIVAFGDIEEAYVIRNVKDVTVVVNPYTRANFGQVEYVGWARSDATIKNRNAYVTLKDTRV